MGGERTGEGTEDDSDEYVLHPSKHRRSLEAELRSVRISNTTEERGLIEILPEFEGREVLLVTVIDANHGDQVFHVLLKAERCRLLCIDHQRICTSETTLDPSHGVQVPPSTKTSYLVITKLASSFNLSIASMNLNHRTNAGLKWSYQWPAKTSTSIFLPEWVVLNCLAS